MFWWCGRSGIRGKGSSRSARWRSRISCCWTADVPEKAQVTDSDLRAVIAEETERLRNYQTKFHQTGAILLEGKTVLIVDDGLATGATAEAAVVSARRQKARRIIVASPVASSHAVERLRPVADEVIALVVDADFAAVGQYYGIVPANDGRGSAGFDSSPCLNCLKWKYWSAILRLC